VPFRNIPANLSTGLTMHCFSFFSNHSDDQLRRRRRATPKPRTPRPSNSSEDGSGTTLKLPPDHVLPVMEKRFKTTGTINYTGSPHHGVSTRFRDYCFPLRFCNKDSAGFSGVTAVWWRENGNDRRRPFARNATSGLFPCSRLKAIAQRPLCPMLREQSPI
jgi:hypothetical protein